MRVNEGCIHVRTRARLRTGRYIKRMSTARIIGVALLIAGIAALCLLSTTTATIVAVVTVLAVAIDSSGSRQRRDAHHGAVMIDLSTRDYVEGINR